jgi:hypothetical protein
MAAMALLCEGNTSRSSCTGGSVLTTRSYGLGGANRKMNEHAEPPIREKFHEQLTTTTHRGDCLMQFVQTE